MHNVLGIGVRMRLLALRALAAYLRVTPDHPGRWRLAVAAARHAPLLKHLKRPVTIHLKEGFRLLVDGTSQTGRIAMATGQYEPATTAVIKQHLRPGGTFVDVGANIGYFSLVASATVGAQGRVVAFEPVAEVRSSLERNLALNDAHVEVRNTALGDQNGQVRFYRGPDEDSGLGSLRPLGSGREIVVLQARFDDIWPPEEPLAFIKIDVEGGEMTVLRGMEASLLRARPILVLEITDRFLQSLGSSASELWGYVHSLGYDMFEIDDSGPLKAIPDSATLASRPSQFNAVCFPRRKEAAL